MTLWVIEPRDPLIVRDGRPFGPDPGARAVSLPFPFPSTIVGGVRGLAGRTAAGGFDRGLIDVVLAQVGLCGPLLVALDADGTIATWYAPAPADALLTQHDPPDASSAELRALRPFALPAGCATDLPDGLVPVGVTDADRPAKAHPDAPTLWRWSRFVQWLSESSPPPQPVQLADIGLRALPVSQRTHVSIVPGTQTAREGFLFQTSGLEFTSTQRERLALVVAVTHDTADPRLFQHFNGGMAPLGGERRLMRWEQLPQHDLPPPPEGLIAQIAQQRACRLVLLTPACFASGYAPDPRSWLLHDVSQPQIQAAAVPQLQIVSGWDMARGAPKPTRRLVRAGSTYFITFGAGATEAEIAAWARARWMQCVSDTEQDRRDGFGLAALGAWDSRAITGETGS